MGLKSKPQFQLGDLVAVRVSSVHPQLSGRIIRRRCSLDFSYHMETDSHAAYWRENWIYIVDVLGEEVEINERDLGLIDPDEADYRTLKPRTIWPSPIEQAGQALAYRKQRDD